METKTKVAEPSLAKKQNEFIYVSVEDIKEHGITKAAILGRIKFWCEYNKANENFIDGHAWSGYLSSKDFELQLGIPRKTIERNIAELLDDDTIVKGRFNTNNYDKTSWYRMFDSKTDKAKKEEDKKKNKKKKAIPQNEEMREESYNTQNEELSIPQNEELSIPQNEEIETLNMSKPIPVNLSDSLSNNLNDSKYIDNDTIKIDNDYIYNDIKINNKTIIESFIDFIGIIGISNEKKEEVIAFTRFNLYQLNVIKKHLKTIKSKASEHWIDFIDFLINELPNN